MFTVKYLFRHQLLQNKNAVMKVTLTDWKIYEKMISGNAWDILVTLGTSTLIALLHSKETLDGNILLNCVRWHYYVLSQDITIIPSHTWFSKQSMMLLVTLGTFFFMGKMAYLVS